MMLMCDRQDVEMQHLPNLLSLRRDCYPHRKITYNKTLRVLRVLKMYAIGRAALQLGRTHRHINRQ